MNRWRAWTASLALALGTGGCASWYVASADREGNAIAAEKTAVVDRFRSDLVDPGGEVPARETREPPVEVPDVLTLDDAVAIATKHNRGYQTQREAYFLSSLGLGLTRRDFLEWISSGTLSWNGSDGRSVDLSETTALALSGSKLLPTGGSVSVSANGSLGTTDTGTDRVQDASLTGSISFSQPLLRGAGRFYAWEALTQAERSAVYAARDFELFRQTFAISTASQFYGLVSLKRSIANADRRVHNQEFLYRQAKSMYRLEQGTQQDMLRAERELRDARNARLDAVQSYELAKDRFKIELGLPLGVEFEVADEIPDPVELDLDTQAAVSAALANRLDLLTQTERLEDTQRAVAIARNNLLPDLRLDVSYGVSGGDLNSFRDIEFRGEAATFGLSLEIPLNRRAQRNAYRSALISLDQSRRSLTQAEDNVILEIRDSLRRLRQLWQQIENDRARIETIDRLRRKAEIDARAGLAGNRDVTEAVNQLTDARNGLNDRYVAYYIARLNLLQRMGLLFVGKQGRIVQ